MIPIKEASEPTDSHCKQGEITKIVEPRKRRAHILLWTDLSISSVDRLNESTSSDHVRQVLADIFVLDEYKTDPRSGIVMDLFFHTLQFAKQEQFSADKTSAFFSIIKSIFEMCIESPFSNKGITLEYFKDLLVCHSVQRPPYSVPLFSAIDVMRISQHTMNTFFRHFDMYKYAFTPEVSLDLKLTYSGMPPTPPLQTDEDKDNDEVNSEESSSVVESNIKFGSDYLDSLQDEITAKEISVFLHTEAKKIQEKINIKMNMASDAICFKINDMMLRTVFTEENRS